MGLLFGYGCYRMLICVCICDFLFVGYYCFGLLLGWVVNSVATSTVMHSLFVNVLCFTSGLFVLIVLFDLCVYLLVVACSLRCC